ncbi:uncharacterized protein L201_000933 [Kwoniella dendrophila CBS 6074]|uniref:Uncharacterized protein n=1 Tax=Kwoniella dendrophila CBS 6074 TaxID=1295534 RepID=A0AAX4JKX6_9TREE
MPAQDAVASGSSSRRAGKESSRSSRRRMGSTGPPVVLGGGVGAIGKAAELGVQNLGPYTTVYNRPATQQQRSPSPSPIVPTYIPSAYPPSTTPPFSTPASNFQPIGASNQQSHSGKGSSSRRSRSPGPNIHASMASTSGSTNSLSTTASTSSRTLQTPYSSKTEHNPIIASSSDTFDSSPSAPFTTQRVKSYHQQSPTPSRTQVPAMAQGPLPPTPLMNEIRPKGPTKPLKILANRGRTPPPLDLKESRLSQDWTHVENPDQDKKLRSPVNTEPVLPPRVNSRLPTAKMVPMKKVSSDLEAPKDRPPFERNMTAPPLSPTPQPQKGGRKSLDHLRSTSPSPAPRQTSLSTPPASNLDAASSSSSSHIWKTTTPKPEKPPMFTRKSEDLLRTSTEIAPTKKEIRAMQQKSLGVASTVVSTPPPEMERKTSGLSLKKSSGALRALFQRGGNGKGKEKESMDTPPLPRRKSGDQLRLPSGNELGRPSIGSRLTPSPVQNSISADSHQRPSFSTDRTMYPTPPPMLRAASTGTASLLNVAGPSKPKKSVREIPAPPPAVSPVSAPSEESPETPSSEMIPSSSLPYLSAMSNRVSLAPPADITPVLDSEDLSFNSKSPNSSSSTPRALDATPIDFSPIRPSKSLHLLSLPDLNLDFDFAFDRFGGNAIGSGSPTTPRRSPRRSPRSPRSPYRGSRASPMGSPVRSFSTRSPRAAPVASRLQRTVSERRRSQSFDGPAGSLPLLDEFWNTSSDMDSTSNTGFISPSVAKFFASASSSSAPMLSDSSSSPFDQSLPVPPQIAQDNVRSRSRSRSTSSELSSTDHARTPSHGSTTNETPSPSPPHTPPERHLEGLGFGDISPEGTIIAEEPTPVELKQDQVASKKPVGLSIAPDIPLPAVPALSLASPALIQPPQKPQFEEQKESSKPRNKHLSLMSRSQVVKPDPSASIRILAREVERLLYSFKYPSQGFTSADRATLLRNELLDLILEVDKRAYDQSEEQAYAMLRVACFEWADALLFELRVEQPANERGACLEGLAAVVESACLSERALKNSAAHQARFTQMMIRCMTFVMSKLGAKGVFHNTLLFSGRFLAFAFFRVPHVGEQLVTVLQPPKGALMRFTRSIFMGGAQCHVKPDYPQHLIPLCFDNSRAYTTRLASLSAEFPTEEERDAFLFQPGNWLRRWQSDDSELFPAFYRAYHRQLAIYLGSVVKHYETLNRPVPASELMRAPGYAHLATIFAKKCHSYILGSVNAVTTSSSSANFEATETAGFRGSQKPPVLDTANRRLVETISTFANLRVMIPDHNSGQMMECDGTQLWSDMIDVWTKNLISKTSLYAPKGVFSLFDLLDGIVDPPFETTGFINGLDIQQPQQQPIYSLLDIPHLIHVIRMILTEGEHALTLVKTIAFVFTHWEVLTARPEDREELCLGLLLQKDLFERLLLFWSQSVRSYILRLVVFRLGHIHTKKEDGTGHLVEIESVKLLETRLDRIRRRHEELEPKVVDMPEETNDLAVPLTPVSETGFGGITRSRSTITMVAESPKYMPPVNKAEKLLGLGLGMEGSNGQAESKGESDNEAGSSGKLGKATKNWFKKSFGNKKKRKDSSSSPSSASNSPIMDENDSPNTPSPSGSPNIATNGQFKASPKIPEIYTSSPISSNEQHSSTSEISPTETSSINRKGKPPTIITTSPSMPPASSLNTSDPPKSPNTFSFEFELPTQSPRSDAFDPSPVQPLSPSKPLDNKSIRRTSQPPSPGQPASPHMSRSFSKRSSLLPPKTASALEGLLVDENDKERLRSIESPLKNKFPSNNVLKQKEDKGYDKKLHAYAIRMLAELEDAQKEYDEWWSEGGVGKMDGAPPRLTVAWPFHDGED